jgi:type IV secretion system protein VirD4
MDWFWTSERDRWASPLGLSNPQQHLGIPALDPRSQWLYGRALPRGVRSPRLVPDRAPVNFWMRPHELLAHAYVPGQIVLGKLGTTLLGHLDDRPMITIAGARAGKTSTMLEPNLYLWPGSCVVLDPKGELTRKSARLRQALGHDVYILDPFGQSGEASACFNPLLELDPHRNTIIDDVAIISQALVVDDGDSRSRHWNDGARKLIQGLILLALRLAPAERHLITVRELLTLSHPSLIHAVKSARRGDSPEDGDKFYDENKAAVQILLRTMTQAGDTYGGVLRSIGKRFEGTPSSERGSMFSTAATQTDFLDSMPLRAISRSSSIGLSALRGNRPTTIYLVLPVGRMESHYRWLRMIIQLACIVLERMGTYPRDRPPILMMLEEFAVLGHMDIMEKAAAYFPGFGVKTWVVLQDIGQIERHYPKSVETFLGNAGLVQCFANGDQTTLEYIARRVEGLIRPFELRTAFSRQSQAQVLLLEGEAPAAAIRLEHSEVDGIRAAMQARALERLRRAFGQ